jgi:phage-related protein
MDMNFTIEYFNARVKAEIEGWPDDLLADFARMVELLRDFGPNIGMPHSRPLGGGLFELRPRGRGGIGRAFYCFAIGRRIVVLHALLKKTQETPEQALRLARQRMKEVQNG